MLPARFAAEPTIVCSIGFAHAPFHIIFYLVRTFNLAVPCWLAPFRFGCVRSRLDDGRCGPAVLFNRRCDTRIRCGSVRPLPAPACVWCVCVNGGIERRCRLDTGAGRRTGRRRRCLSRDRRQRQRQRQPEQQRPTTRRPRSEHIHTCTRRLTCSCHDPGRIASAKHFRSLGTCRLSLPHGALTRTHSSTSTRRTCRRVVRVVPHPLVESGVSLGT